MNSFLSASYAILLRTGLALAASNIALAQPSSPEPKSRERDALLRGVAQGWYVTPEDFGAIGNDGKDDSDAFDQLADVMRRDAAVLIPAKRYHISRTWRLPYVQGGRIMGLGGLAHHDIKLGSRLRGPGAELAWIGEAGGTMVRVSGVNLVWDAVALYGRSAADVGLLMLKPTTTRGLGTGKHTFRGLSVHGCRVGIRLGQGGENVDSCVFEYTYTEKCAVGVLLDADMAMGHYFTYLHIRDCPIAVWVRRGGDLVVRGGLNTSTGTFLKIGDEGRHINPGRNNGMILVEGVKTDAQNKDMQWLEAVKGDCAITFQNCQEAWTQDGSAYPRNWTLRGAVKLTIRDSINLFGLNSFVLERKGASQKPNVLLDRCRVDFGRAPADWIKSTTGHFRFRVRDCYRGDGEPLVDADEAGPEDVSETSSPD
jgi:hypothetical protein